jgi:hypothetical protein
MSIGQIVQFENFTFHLANFIIVVFRCPIIGKFPSGWKEFPLLLSVIIFWKKKLSVIIFWRKMYKCTYTVILKFKKNAASFARHVNYS